MTIASLSIIDQAIVLLVLMATILAAIHASRSRGVDERLEALAGRSLGPWILALSAGATANSGFVLTGAVGLGYQYGLMWCLLPFGWLIGDLLFWFFFAAKLNRLAREKNAVTLPEFLASHSNGDLANAIRITSALILVLLLTVYGSSQWLSAGKIANYVFGTPEITGSLVFGLFVVGYTAFSGFRGAVYTDFVQAIFMAILAIAMLSLSALLISQSTASSDLPPGFLSLTGILTWWQVLLFVTGFTAASLGFNLGEPQMVTRWMSGKSEADLRKARWIYIGFLQLTWTSYTVLGALIRLTIKNVSDPEQGLFLFVNRMAVPGLMGLLISGAIATIASTGASLLAVCGEMLRNDIGKQNSLLRSRLGLFLVVMSVATVSFGWLFIRDMNVFRLSITAVSLVGAALAAPMLYCLTLRTFSGVSCLLAISVGLGCGILWRQLGLSEMVNEALPSVVVGIALLALLNFRRLTLNSTFVGS